MITLPNGQTVEKAFRGIAASSQEKLALAIRSGVFSGETTQQIARRLVGDLNFEDLDKNVKQIAKKGGDVTKLANYQIQTIVRTSVNQVQNQASQAVYAANSKVAPKYEYVATLDSRTTPICQRLDGEQFEYNKGQHLLNISTVGQLLFLLLTLINYKKNILFEKPPATALDTRPSITGRVPQGQAYGDWLLNQKKIYR